MEGGHKVGQGPRHLELYLDGLRGEDERVLMGERDQAKEPRGLGRAPLPTCAVWERHHHCLQLGANYLELAHRLELHGLASEVLLGGDRVGKDVEQELRGARGVNSERHSVADHRLKSKV